MDLTDTFLRLGVATGLGLLVGLQRERQAMPLAGIRTFTLITVLGAVAALLAPTLGGWVVAAGWVALAGVVIATKVLRREIEETAGTTTDVTALLMYGVGAYLIVGALPVAIALGGGVAVLLQFKRPLHRFVLAIGESDLRAIMQFVLITLVILPILPNHPLRFDPFQVLNPRHLWIMVVLVVGISLAGYVAYKLLGPRVGLLLAGVLGGMISSTATTISYARKTRGAAGNCAGAAVVIALASTIMYLRVPVLIGAVSTAALRPMAPPMLCMFVLMAAMSLVLLLLPRESAGSLIEHGNPSELKTALLFAMIFAVVLVATAAARQYLGVHALYAVGMLAGLTDVDAITLSTTQMVRDRQLGADSAWRVILVASLSNFVFKGAAVAFLADRRLWGRIAAVFGVAFAGGVALLILWPR
jgi:uncharacterized membrane protein (DUF4010 family)